MATESNCHEKKSDVHKSDNDGITEEKGPAQEQSLGWHDTRSGTNIAPLEIGDRCDVTWRDGSRKLAEVIERRDAGFRARAGGKKGARRRTVSDPTADHGPLSVPPNLSNGAGTGSGNVEDAAAPTSAADMEYYVHYIPSDRRLDEWIRIERFHLDTLDRYADRIARSKVGKRGGGMVDLTTADGVASSSRSGGASSRREKRERRRNQSGSADGGNKPSKPNKPGEKSLADLEKEHEEITKVKNISRIRMGDFEVDTWYFSPFPKEYSGCERLYVCEYCLKYMRRRRTFKMHAASCPLRSPPGTEIYREGGGNHGGGGRVSVFEVDGKENRIYCQNLCLLAKLFLDHKTLYYDVDPFIFYVITQVDEDGAHIVGYFSKEKVSAEDYNLACILTFPQYQKLGFGTFIISLSYELSRRERKVGSPEKPLSDLGKISYRSYWTYVLMHFFAGTSASENLGIHDISKKTAIKTEDIISTLQSLGMIQQWKGQYVIHVDQKIVQSYTNRKKRMRMCKSNCLHWEPPDQKKKNESACSAGK